jgi:hypothetical protein
MDPIAIVTVLVTAFYVVGNHSIKKGYINVFGNGHMQENITKYVSTSFQLYISQNLYIYVYIFT